MIDLQNSHIGFLGAGNMAEAIVRGLLNGKVVSAGRIMLSDPSAERRILFQNTFSVSPVTDNRTVIEKCDVVILAVKPQFMKEAVEPFASHFRKSQLVISIAAGIKTSTLHMLCGEKPAVIRIMPNTPALIGKGVSAICAGPGADEGMMKLAESLFRSVGSTLRVEEKAMDAVTAISGSGPAYVFYWMEAMLKAAEQLGFNPETARQLVYETMTGAAALANSTHDSPEILRARVTSKGGTTEAAIRTLNENGVAESLIKAVQAAADRSRELSQSS